MDFALVLLKDLVFNIFFFLQLLKDVVKKTERLKGHHAEERRTEELKRVTLEQAVLHMHFNSEEY